MFAQMFPIGRSLPDDRRLIGGKAAGLGTLCRAGAAVPQGVVVVVPAASTAGTTAHTRQLIDHQLSAVGRAGERFAVRSSTVLEDGAEASYAGMFETFLNVPVAEVWSAVETCMAATESERVTAYQAARDLQADDSACVPIIIQRMVRATAAGVGFSIHPVSPTSSTMVIEAVHGLGDRLVSGYATPDLYEVDTADGTLMGFEPGEDHVQMGDALDLNQLIAIADLMMRMRRMLGFEVDVEFAFEGSELFALQVRPITTLGAHVLEVGAA